MGFEPLETVRGQNHQKTKKATISYRRVVYRHGQGLPKLYIGIPAIVANGFTPQEGQFYGFMLGTGQDKGKARLMPLPPSLSLKTGCCPRKVRGSVTFSFGSVPALGDLIADKEQIDVRLVSSDCFELDLPSWFKTATAK